MASIAETIMAGTAGQDARQNSLAQTISNFAGSQQAKVNSDRTYELGLRNADNNDQQINIQKEEHAARMQGIKDVQEQEVKARSNKFTQDFMSNTQNFLQQVDMLQGAMREKEQEIAAVEDYASKTNATADGPRTGKALPKNAAEVKDQKPSPINDTLQLANEISNKRTQFDALKTQYDTVQNSLNTHVLSFLRNKTAVYTALQSDISNYAIRDLLEKAFKTDDPKLQEQFASSLIQAGAMDNMLANERAQATFEKEYKLKVGPATVEAATRTPRMQKVAEINAPVVSGMRSFLESNVSRIVGNAGYGKDSFYKDTLDNAFKGLEVMEPEELNKQAQLVPSIIKEINNGLRTMEVHDTKWFGVLNKATEASSDAILSKLEKRRGVLSPEIFAILSTYAQLGINNPDLAINAAGKLPTLPNE